MYTTISKVTNVFRIRTLTGIVTWNIPSQAFCIEDAQGGPFA